MEEGEFLFRNFSFFSLKWSMNRALFLRVQCTQEPMKKFVLSTYTYLVFLRSCDHGGTKLMSCENHNHNIVFNSGTDYHKILMMSELFLNSCSWRVEIWGPSFK